jgi:hypothetical protein
MQEGAARRAHKNAKKKSKVAEASEIAARKLKEAREKTKSVSDKIWMAALRGDWERVKKGIWEEGVDPCLEGEVGKGKAKRKLSLMHLCVQSGTKELVEWLIRHG